MKNWLKIIAIVVFLSVAFHLLTIYSWPRVAMIVTCKVIERQAGGPNIMFHSEPKTEDNNVIVMQNADTLSSWFCYDLSSGPVRISASVPDSYWSVSFYDMDTNNYYVKNDGQVGEEREVELVLVGENSDNIDADGLETVVAPTKRGVVLLRTLVREEEYLAELIEIQKKASCEPL